MDRELKVRQSLINQTKSMTDAEFREVIESLFNYAQNKRVPTFTNGRVRRIFEAYMPVVDMDNDKANEDLRKNYIRRLIG